jgi:hypothetical protein
MICHIMSLCPTGFFSGGTHKCRSVAVFSVTLHSDAVQYGEN